MSDLTITIHKTKKTRKTVKKAQTFLSEVAALSKNKVNASFNDSVKPPTKSSNAQAATQLNTGWPLLPLRKIPMCEFCYMQMGSKSIAKYCKEHDMGGHQDCYNLHLTTTHEIIT